MRNFKQARIDTNLSQNEIANKLGVSLHAVYLWEQGRANVARRHWSRLASIFRVSEKALEEILIQTIIDACIASKDNKMLIKAHTSRLYSPELLMEAIERWQNMTENTTKTESPVDFERERLEFERAILERDKHIFELEKQVEELRRELERRRPVSLSSVLNIEPLETEVKS